MEDAPGELAVATQHPAESEVTRRLVERRLVRPGTAVDVVEGDVPVAFDPPEALELAGAFVHGTCQLHGLDVARRVERKVPGTVRVSEETRADQQAASARRDVSGLEAEQRVVLTLHALLDRRAP